MPLAAVSQLRGSQFYQDAKFSSLPHKGKAAFVLTARPLVDSVCFKINF
ncbi:MAG: hypothetical protein IKC35_02450 [Clostridia bacterium]|nr:hypothetical protein [Clostridia bacterium]